MKKKTILIISIIVIFFVIICKFVKYFENKNIARIEKIKTVVILTFFIGAIILFVTLNYYSNKNLCNINTEYVSEKETALKIAKAIYEAKTGNVYKTEDFLITFYKETNEWHVYTIKEYNPNNSIIDCKDGYYGLYINAATGSVTKMGIER